ncbi:hypothetical protein MMYC01_203587 [Madurella mycetomatis]|uniref:Uncharacterized protein n=1 Tax=Madurella mycetomatis TaxID=100816 RepID=A0A175W9I2_9PEZI|nr:hypothetical protein MMYC01_203587 [Madurella mycetomatis]
MSSAGQDQPAQRQATALPSRAEASSAAPPAKRLLADDDVQFVSSNPVKKRQGTNGNPTKKWPNRRALLLLPVHLNLHRATGAAAWGEQEVNRKILTRPSIFAASRFQL